jgi:hypothetical protein
MQHTPAPELDAETIEAAAARVAAMNLSADKPSIAAEAPARAPRSDKGKRRALKVQTLSIEAVSAMSAEQAQELIRLVAARNETLKNWKDAQREAEKCEADFKLDTQALQDFIEALAVTK